MINPKSTIFSKLSEIDDVAVFQDRPEVIEDFPTITFNISNNVPTYALNKSTGRENIDVKIDIWADTSIETGALLLLVEEKMKELNYLCTFSADLQDPDGISHVTTVFTY